MMVSLGLGSLEKSCSGRQDSSITRQHGEVSRKANIRARHSDSGRNDFFFAHAKPFYMGI
jgi:hypothetical protein